VTKIRQNPHSIAEIQWQYFLIVSEAGILHCDNTVTGTAIFIAKRNL